MLAPDGVFAESGVSCHQPSGPLDLPKVNVLLDHGIHILDKIAVYLKYRRRAAEC